MVEIKCPFCGQTFDPHVQRDTTTGGNIVRGAIFVPWGIVKALGSKKYVLCPHCNMKIMQ